MDIRAAGAEDIDELAGLAAETYVAAFGHSMSTADLQAHLAKNLTQKRLGRIIERDCVLIAEVDGRMVGYAQFGAVEAGMSQASAGDTELFRLYVHPEFQNQGIGARLMDAMLDDPVMQTAGRIFLDVWEHNSGARRFYERYGFEVAGAREFVVESGAETSLDLIMVRIQSS